MNNLSAPNRLVGGHRHFTPCSVSEVLKTISPDEFRLLHPGVYEICCAEGFLIVGFGWPTIWNGAYSVNDASKPVRGTPDGAWKCNDAYYAISFVDGVSWGEFKTRGRFLLLRKDTIENGRIRREPPRPITLRAEDGTVIRICI